MVVAEYLWTERWLSDHLEYRYVSAGDPDVQTLEVRRMEACMRENQETWLYESHDVSYDSASTMPRFFHLRL